MNNSLTTLLAGLLAGTIVHAEWVLIDDFQQWTDGTVFDEATDFGWHSVNELTNETYIMLSDPDDASNLSLYPALSTAEPTGFNWISKELPGEGIAPGEIGTIRFRARWTGSFNSWHIGTTDVPAQFDDTTGEQTAPGAMEDFNALIRLNPETNEIEAWDGDGFSASEPSFTPEPNRWYTFYLVIRNTWKNTGSTPVSTGSCGLFLEYASGWTPYLVTLPFDGGIMGYSSFRRAPADASGTPRNIKSILFGTNLTHPISSSSVGPIFLDDFYFFKGKNLPLTTADVDTGDWLGWINIAADPYIFSYSLGSWLYIEDLYTTDPGAWMYIYK